MTAKVSDIAKLPGWPRWLSREQAAAYVGVSPKLFDLEVKIGIWPKGKKRGFGKVRDARITWDRVQLDAHSDAGLNPRTPRQAETLEEAAEAWAGKSK